MSAMQFEVAVSAEAEVIPAQPDANSDVDATEKE